MITKMDFDRIKNCRASLAYVDTQPDLATAWENCARPDWLIAFAHKAGIAEKAQFVRIAIGDAEAVLPIWLKKHPDDGRPAKAIEASKAWLVDPTPEKAAYAADAYAYDAYAYAAYAAYAYDADASAAYAAAAASAAADAYAYDACAAAAASAYADAYAYDAYAYDAYAAYAYAAAASEAASAFKKAQCVRIRAIIANPFK